MQMNLAAGRMLEIVRQGEISVRLVLTDRGDGKHVVTYLDRAEALALATALKEEARKIA